MNRLKYLVLAAIAAFALTACEPAATTPAGNETAKNVNANTAGTTTAAAAPTADALMTLERSAYDALKNKDAKFWGTFLAANFVGIAPNGKMDKAAATTMYTGLECEIKNTALSEQLMTQLSPDAFLITYKVTQDGTCGGEKLPANEWAATIYIREGSGWKAAFHANQPIPDPNAKPAPVAKKAAPASPNAAQSDAAAQSLLALEKKAWDAWVAKDAKGLEEWTGSNMIAFTSKGRENRADAVKGWTTDGCEVKSVNFSDPSSTSFGPDIALLTFKAMADGKCDGNMLPPLQGATLYTKEGAAWKAAFTVNLPLQ